MTQLLIVCLVQASNKAVPSVIDRPLLGLLKRGLCFAAPPSPSPIKASQELNTPQTPRVLLEERHSRVRKSSTESHGLTFKNIGKTES